MPKALNAETVQVNLQFTADTAQAKKELRQLQDTLKSLTTNPAGGQTLSREMAEASRYAAELSVHLKKAINPNSGMLDFSRLNESIKKSGMSLSQYGDKLLSLGPQGRQAFSQLASAVSQSEIPIRRINNTLAQMGTVLKNTIRWQLSSTAIHAFSGAIHTAYNYAKDLNESLNNIRIVTGYNINQMEKFAQTANKAARELSTSTLDYTNAALIYYQQGLSDKEVEARTNVTAKMANVTKQSAEEVSNQLTAIWNNYAKGADNLEYFADVITALGAATASSSKEISTGLEKFAAIGETVGLSYEYATAALATVTATTRQSAEVVGNSFKTLFSRIQGLKLGETQDDGTDLNKYSAALLSVGVNIKDASGQLKDMDVILEETAAKWQHLGKEQQMALAQTVGGVRQYTQFIALMDNWDFMQKNLQTAYDSSGTLQKQQDTFAQGWRAAAQQVKTAWEDVYSTLINDDFFIDLLNFVEKAVNGIKNLIGALGGMPGILTTIGSLVMTIFGKQMAEGLTSMTYSIQSLTASGRAKIANERQAELNTMGYSLEKFSNNASGSDQAWSAGLRNQISLQNELTQNVEKLSETERFVTSILQDQYKERSKLAVAAAAEVDAAKQAADADLDRQRRQAQLEAQKNGATFKGKDFTTAYTSYKSAYTEHANLLKSRTNTPFIQAFNSVPSKVTTEQVRQLQQFAQDFSNKYSDALQSAMKSPQAQQRMSEFLKLDLTKVDVNSKDVKRIVESAANSLTAGLNNAVDQSSAELVGLGEAAEQAGVNIQQVEQVTDAEIATTERAAQVNKELAMTYNLIGEYIESAKLKTMTWQEQVVSLGQVAMSAGMVFNSINGLINTWKNADMTFGEKLFSSFTSIGMMMPMLMKGFESLKASMASIRIQEQLTAVAAQHGLTIDETRKAIAAARLLLKGEELTEGQTELLQRAGILGTETTEQAVLSENIILQKLFNAETWKNPYVIAGAAILAVLVGMAVALKQISEKEKERAKIQKEADQESLNKAAERVEAIKEETNALHDLVSAVEKSVNAYDGSSAAKEELFNTTKALLDQYDIEGASLLLLQGRYDELIKKVKDYEEAQRQQKIAELEEKEAVTYDSVQIGYYKKNNGKGPALSSLYNNLSDEQKSALAYYDASGYGSGVTLTDRSSKGIVNAYEGLQAIRQGYLDAGAKVTDTYIQDLDKQIAALSEYYDQAKAIVSEKIELKDESIGYNTLKDTEVSIDNVSSALSKLTENYKETSASTEEAEKKARLYLKTQADWNEAFTAYDAIKQKQKNGQGGSLSEDELINIYNQLQTDAERMIFFQIAFKAGASEQEILEAIRTGSTGIEMQIHTANASALAEATNNFKKNMSVQETKDWANKYGVSFGDENSSIGMELRDFMGMSDTKKQAYLSNRTLEKQNLAYEKANQYYEENKDKSDIKTKEELLKQREDLEHLRDTTTDASLLQGIEQALTYINAQINEVTANLEEAETNILEGNARKMLEFTSALEKVKDLNLGDTITQEELNNLTDGIDKNLEQYFVPNEDGTWTLVVSQVDLKEGIQDALDRKEGPLSKEQQVSLINTASNYNELIQLQGKNNIESDIAIGKIQTLASKYEDCTDEVRVYQKALKESGKGSTEANKAYTNLVNSIKRNEFKELGKNLSSVLKNLDKLKDYEKIDTFKEISKQLKEFYNIASDDTRMDENWVSTHLDWIKDLFNGTKEESDAAANKIKQDIYSVEELTLEALTEIKNGNLDATVKVNLDGSEVELEAEAIKGVLDLLDDSDIELLATGKADFSDLLAKLSTTAAGAQAVADLLAALGQSSLDINVSGGETGGAGIKADGKFHVEGGGPQFMDIEGADDIAALSSVIDSLKNKKISVSGYVPAVGNGGIKAVDTGSGGGGGTAKTETHKNEEKRYEYEEELLSDLEKQYDRLAKAKDRVYGNKRVAAIQKEIDKLKERIAAQKQLLAEVEKYAKSDLDELLNGKENAFEISPKAGGNPIAQRGMGLSEILKGTGITPSFDELGNIINIEAIRQAIEDYYNAAVDAFNTTHDEDAWNIAKGQVDWITKQLDQYLETINKKTDEENKLQDMLWEQQDLAAEKINTKIEYRIQLEKNEIAMIESALRVIENNVYKSIEAATMLNDKFLKTLEYSKNLQDDYDEWKTAFENGEISDEAYREHMQDIFDKAGDSIEDLMSQWEHMSEYYAEVLDKFDERLKLETRVFGNLIDELEYYSELMDLSGKEQDYDKKLEIIRGEQQILKDRLAVDKETQSIYQREYDALKQAYDDALASGDTDKAEFLLPSVQAAADKLDEINQQVRDDVKQIAELAQKEFSTTLDKVYHEAELKLTGGLGFDYLSQTMDLASKRAEEYLTKTNQIYETSQLIRNINRDIDKTDNTAAKARLKNFSDEIQALQEKGELSKYELEDAKARYEILKAQIALEEAQNAKATVRLQRDSEGNYGYVYTADRDKIEQAEDNLAKAQNDRYNLALETQQEYLRKFYDTEREAQEALRKLDEDYAAGRIGSEEEYRKRRQEIIEYYSELLSTYEDINTQALQVMNETAAEHINDSWTKTFGDEGYGLIGKAEQWETVTIEDTEAIDDAFKTLKDVLETIVEPEYDNLTGRIKEATDESEKLRNKLVDEFLPQMSDVIEGVRNMTLEWSNYTDQLMAALKALQELQAAANQQIKDNGEAPENPTEPTPEPAQEEEEEPEQPSEPEDTGWPPKSGDLVSWTGNAPNRVFTVNGKSYNWGTPEADLLQQRLNQRYNEGAIDWFNQTFRYNTGGYTGDWVGGSDLYNGKLAMLHEKELVLNQDDTKNMLATVHLVRQLSDIIDLQALSSGAGSKTGGSLDFEGYKTTIEQDVTIHAEFPNVSDRNEIEAAFDNLVNKAAQYAHRY